MNDHGNHDQHEFPQNIEQRQQHYAQYFGGLTEQVLHCTDDRRPHVDLYQFPPHEDHNYWTLMTGGMSDLKQPHAPEEISGRTELILYVQQPDDWAYQLLLDLASYPFASPLHLDWFHTIEGAPNTSIVGEPSQLQHLFLLPPYFEEQSLSELKIAGEEVRFLWVFPITQNELNYKLKNGSEKLDELFAEQNLPAVITPSRTSVV